MMGHSDVERPMFRGAERRASIRVFYETVAMVAEYDGENFPVFSAFWEVNTKDLSATGMGFMSDRNPSTPSIIVMLGNPQANPILIEARVARSIPETNDGLTVYRVGCEWIRRLST